MSRTHKTGRYRRVRTEISARWPLGVPDHAANALAPLLRGFDMAGTRCGKDRKTHARAKVTARRIERARGREAMRQDLD